MTPASETASAAPQAEIEAFFDPSTSTVTYLVWDADTRRAAVIDPVLDYEPNSGTLDTKSIDMVLRRAVELDLSVMWALDTHAHADHLSASDHVRRKLGARIGIGAQITKVQATFAPLFHASDVSTDGAVFDALFDDGAVIPLGRLSIEVMHTPGHTPACVTYVVGDAAFVGDTLFMPDYGTARADFPGGDAATLFRSIRRILELPPATRIFVGHDYLPATRTSIAWETTVARQRKANVHVHDGVSEVEFVAARKARDKTLAAPRLILPSLQVNIRAGALPPAEADGQVYLKIPVNRLAAKAAG
ncbi:MBL fold metallo-hydrolase [bacterium]|nr:MBL fold metallo-hydrolase [bacterium]